MDLTHAYGRGFDVMKDEMLNVRKYSCYDD